MSLRYTLPSHGHRQAGKFQHRDRPGIETGHGQTYAGWSYQLIRHQAGTTVRRTVYNVAVNDGNGHRAAYMQGFATAERAAAAARGWIEQHSTSQPAK